VALIRQYSFDRAGVSSPFELRAGFCEIEYRSLAANTLLLERQTIQPCSPTWLSERVINLFHIAGTTSVVVPAGEHWRLRHMGAGPAHVTVREI
jgi:hypothetical protein